MTGPNLPATSKISADFDNENRHLGTEYLVAHIYFHLKTGKTMAQDNIYKGGTVQEDFTFNDRVAEVFDDMLNRSIPFYQTVIDGMAGLLRAQVNSGATVYDLGCSTGSTLLELSRRLADMKLHYIGIDNAPAMLAKARLKAEMFSKTDVIEFREDDITKSELPGADVIICNYTLQFLRPMVRTDFIKKLHDTLPAGGMFFLSEKVLSRSSSLNRQFITMYHQFKLQHGYSELEIAAKREALENVLIPFSVEENNDLLLQAGFSSVETFFKWFNFTSIVAIKEKP